MSSEDEKRNIGRQNEWEEKEQSYNKFIHTQNSSNFINEYPI